MAFNPLQNYLGGQQAGQQQQAFDIAGRLSQSERPQLEPEFQRLMQLDPARAKQFVDIAASGDASRANAMIQDAKGFKWHLQNGNADAARELLNNRSSAIGTRPSQATAELSNILDTQGPDAALGAVNGWLGMFDPDAKQVAKKAGEDTADIKNFNMLEELKRTGSPDQVAAFKKMTGLLSDPKMSASLEKQIVKSQDDFFKFSEQARQMDVLANDIGRMSIGGGLASTVSETFKNILGSQDDVTSLRRRFNAIRTSQATSNLPPGPASDKDIQMALSGFPPENANADIITSFLRGQQKLAKVNEKFAEFKSNFYAVNKSPSGLLPAWKNYAENNEMFGEDGASNPASTGNSLNFDAQGNLIQ